MTLNRQCCSGIALWVFWKCSKWDMSWVPSHQPPQTTGFSAQHVVMLVIIDYLWILFYFDMLQIYMMMRVCFSLECYISMIKSAFRHGTIETILRFERMLLLYSTVSKGSEIICYVTGTLWIILSCSCLEAFRVFSEEKLVKQREELQ